jgi:hypothetical protein
LICNKGYRISFVMHAQSGVVRQHIGAVKDMTQRYSGLSGEDALVAFN